MKALIITRHSALVAYLIEKGYVSADSEVIEHATADNVRGRHVWGVLPHSLSCLTKSFTEVPMSIPAEMRGKELTLENMYSFAGAPVTYVVNTQQEQAIVLESYFHWGANSCTPDVNWLKSAIGEDN